MSDHDHKHPHLNGHNCGHDHGNGSGFKCDDTTGEASTHSGCSHEGHDHHDHSNCGHGHSADGHSHHHGHDDEKSHHNGALKFIFSKVGGLPGEKLKRHRKKIVLGATAVLAGIEYKTTGTSLISAWLMTGAAALVAFEASEDIMEATGNLNKSQGLAAGVVGMGVSVVHSLSEAFLTVASKAGDYTDLAVTSVMNSNVFHIPLMAGAAALIGSVGVDKSYAWKINTTAMTAVTGFFGYQIAAEHMSVNPSAAGIATSAAFIFWRFRAGQTCAIHGDACGHTHNQDDTDYLSISYAQNKIKQIGNSIKNISTPTETKSLEHSEKSTKSSKDQTSNLSLPLREQIYTRLSDKNIWALGASAVVLGVSAHILGDNVIEIANHNNLGSNSAGAIVSIANGAPELILILAAAAKHNRDMAASAIYGCTIGTLGLVGGLQGLMGLDVPASLDLATTEGKVQMSALFGSVAAIALVTHEKVAKGLARVDNAAAEWLESKDFIERTGRVSKWLRNDGTKIAKVAAAPMLAAAIAFYATVTQPNCHWHGSDGLPHCIDTNAAPRINPDDTLTYD